MDRFERDGLVFDVADEGPRDGEVVVLLHGFPQDHTAWQEVVPLLHAAGLRTLAPDQRGYSPGARPPGSAPYRLGECCRDVVALLDAAGVERAHVVGHDWGGAVAWALAGTHPERVRSLVVLSTPHPAALAWAFTHSTQALNSWYMGFFQLPWLPEQVLRRAFPEALVAQGLPRASAQRYADRLREPGALTAALAWYRALPGSLLGGRPAPSRRVTAATTYLWGQRDFALARAGAQKTGAFVSGPYRFVQLDAGHWLPETRPDTVAASILEQVRAVREAPGSG